MRREFYTYGYRLDIHERQALIVRAGIVIYGGSEADCRDFLERAGAARTCTMELLEEIKFQLARFTVG